MGHKQTVSEWLASYIKEPLNDVGILVQGEELLVTATDLHEHWAVYSKKEQPKLKQISRALSSLSYMDKRLCKRSPNGNINYWRIRQTDLFETSQKIQNNKIENKLINEDVIETQERTIYSLREGVKALHRTINTLRKEIARLTREAV